MKERSLRSETLWVSLTHKNKRVQGVLDPITLPLGGPWVILRSFLGLFPIGGQKILGVKIFGLQKIWGVKIFGGQNFWGQNFWGSKFFEVKFFEGSKFSSYIFIKSLIQNQTKLEFDFKDPVLLL